MSSRFQPPVNSAMLRAATLRARILAADPAELERVLRLMERPTQIAPVLTAADAAPWFCAELAGLATEHLMGLFLDARCQPIAVETLSVGTANYTIVDPRHILRRALLLDAHSLLIAHNHPSGSCEPSRDDITSTHVLGKAAHTVGVKLRDHLVFGADDTYLSLASRGDMAIVG